MNPSKPKEDIYSYFNTRQTAHERFLKFTRRHGIELTIGVVGLLVGIATVLVGYKIGVRQEVLQATKITDSYFNGIGDLLSRFTGENQKINLLVIARTEAIISDLNRLQKPNKIASIITYVSSLKPELFYKDLVSPIERRKYLYLGEINLKGVHFWNINLQSARLPETNLEDSNLTRTDFSRAYLKGTNFKNAILHRTNFQDADLQESNLRNARIDPDTNFEGANLENAIWLNGLPCKPGSIGKCLQ